jgi:hypothetical protein
VAINGYTVSGTSFIYVGTGIGGALQLLGYTEGGTDQNVKENKREIMTDLFGDMTPQDFQDMGAIARVVCPFIAIDRTVMASIQLRGDQQVTGELNTPGLVLGVSGWSFPLAISSEADLPWYFPAALTLNEETRLATKANPMKLEFFCWPFVSYTATTGKGVPLWTRVIP